jgi:hypothetical protein
MKSYLVLLVVSAASICASEILHEKATSWGEDTQARRIITVMNKACFPIKVRMKNFGDQSYTIAVSPYAWETKYTDWEHNTKWRVIAPQKLYSFYIPMRYVLPKNKKMSSYIEYNYGESYLQVRAVGEAEKTAYKNKIIRLKQAALDHAKYQVKIKHIDFAVMQIKQPAVT